MWTLIAGIVLEGLKVFSEERRTRFMDEYHDIITEIESAKTDRSDNYTDARIDVGKKRKKLFLEAYHKELKAHNESA